MSRYLLLALIVSALLLSACSGSSKRVMPADELSDSQDGASVSTVWSSNAGRGIHSVGDGLDPLIEDGRVWVADRRGELTAWDLESGDRVWRKRLGKPVSGGPALADDLLVVGTREGELIALDRETEEERWRSKLSSEIVSVPAISGDAVVVLSGDGRLVAMSRESGSRRWSYDRSMPPLTLRGTSNPKLLGSTVLAGLPNGRLVAVNLGDGSEAWQVDVGVATGSSDLDRMRDVDGDPVIAGSQVYVVGYQGQAMALDLQQGRVEWARDLSSFSGLDVDSERVYVTEANGRVWALDRRSGAAIWRQDELEGIRGTAPVVVGDMVVLGDDRGRLTVLDSSDGAILARVRIDRSNGISRNPVVVDDDVVVLTDGGRLQRLRLSRGGDD
ncbi:outer membrane protein assembly factor BamB [Methylonatrum kenyense]|uniref:outer membrane protein assembly factor BamB n=1 Tax=Methylonatrum kenyense TaxID=455253 RepID=UPI0020C12B0D|nr:outer membrane protein assembly factor BamB [Methylonatrum kenyense]MCK8515554.1 outer membrane protein assembly factor BamB [Methylonatrum kenyense]